jgi:hypothetical protein
MSFPTMDVTTAWDIRHWRFLFHALILTRTLEVKCRFGYYRRDYLQNQKKRFRVEPPCGRSCQKRYTLPRIRESPKTAASLCPSGRTFHNTNKASSDL